MWAPKASVVYAVSPFARSDVKSQNFPSKMKYILNAQKKLEQNAHCVSLINAILLHSSSVASGVGGTPETNEKPNLC